MLKPTWWYLEMGLWELITVRVSHEGGALMDGLKRRGRGEVSLLSGTEKRPCDDGMRRWPSASQEQSSCQEPNWPAL